MGDVGERQVLFHWFGAVLSARLLRSKEYGVPWVAKRVMYHPPFLVLFHVVQAKVERDRCRCSPLFRRLRWFLPHFVRVFRVLRRVPWDCNVGEVVNVSHRDVLHVCVRFGVLFNGQAHLQAFLCHFRPPSTLLRDVARVSNANACIWRDAFARAKYPFCRLNFT